MLLYLSAEERDNYLGGNFAFLKERLAEQNQIVEKISESVFQDDEVRLDNLYEFLSLSASKELIDEPFIIEVSPEAPELLSQGYILVRHTKRHDILSSNFEISVYFARYDYDLTTNPTFFNGANGELQFSPFPDKDLEAELKELEKMVSTPEYEIRLKKEDM